MNDLQPTNRGAQPKGASIWTFLIVCLVLALLGLGALGYALYTVNGERNRLRDKVAAQQLEDQRRQLEAQQGAGEAKLVHARNVQDQVLAQVQTATNRLLQLLAQCDALRTDAAALLTNDAGRQVGLHPPLVGVARRFYEASLPTLPAETEITTQLEAVRRIGVQVQKNLNTAYEPSGDLTNTTHAAVQWSEAAASQVKQLRDALDALRTEGQVKFTRATLPPESPNLADALKQLGQQQATNSLQQAEQTVVAARTSAAELRAQAEAESIRAQAEREAAATRAKVQEDLAAQQRALDEREARLKNELQEREAQLKVAESKTRVAVATQEDEARKVVLRQKASEPAVLAELAPFLTPGYYQIDSLTTDLKPLSYTKIMNAGALANDVRGLTTLLKIAWTSADRVRPRWKMNPQLFLRHPDEVERIKRVQQLLLELGPVLVEMGKLQP
jgi:hypothetical protein